MKNWPIPMKGIFQMENRNKMKRGGNDRRKGPNLTVSSVGFSEGGTDAKGKERHK